MPKNIKRHGMVTASAWILASVVIFTPFIVSSAPESLVPCGNNKEEGACDFNDLIELANRVVSFLIWDIVIPLTALAFMVIGGNFVVNQNKESARTSAKNQLQQVGIGIFWIIAAFVLVKAFLFVFLNTADGFTAFLLA